MRPVSLTRPDQYPYDGAAARIKVASENGINGSFAWLKATGYTSMRITSSTSYPELVGQYLSEIAAEREQDPFDLVAELYLGSEEPVGITLGAIKEPDVQELMRQPWNMIASDGAYSNGESPRPGQHPRSTGTFPRVLGRYVREWQVITLEDAVRKMTSLPAEFLGLENRGRLAEGYVADVTVFDAATIIDNSTWDEPHLFSTGVIHVLVNGTPVLRDTEITGEAPGAFVRR